MSVSHFFSFLALTFASSAFAAINAADLVEKSEFHVRGKTHKAHMSMEVTRGTATRNMEMQVWSVGTEKAFIRILQPAKDKGTTNLRMGLELWQYLPNIERIVKIPPSMMLQSWMGSDFTNDDLVKTSSLSRDYTHKALGEEKYEGMDAVKIECTPKADAPVVWGKIHLWVRKGDGVPLKREFYSEKGELLKVMTGFEVKTFGNHTLPTKLVMKDLKKADAQTTLRYLDVEFDKPIADSVFSQQNLRKP